MARPYGNDKVTSLKETTIYEHAEAENEYGKSIDEAESNSSTSGTIVSGFHNYSKMKFVSGIMDSKCNMFPTNRSELSSSIPSRRKEITTLNLKFPQRLRLALQDEENHDIIRWHSNGLGFKVFDKNEFEHHVLPKYFVKQTQYWSFTRKLGRWGFLRTTNGPESGSYSHPLFQRDQPNLMRKMSCLQMVSTEVSHGSSPIQHNAPNERKSEIGTIKTRHCSLECEQLPSDMDLEGKSNTDYINRFGHGNDHKNVQYTGNISPILEKVVSSSYPINNIDQETNTSNEDNRDKMQLASIESASSSRSENSITIGKMSPHLDLILQTQLLEAKSLILQESIQRQIDEEVKNIFLRQLYEQHLNNTLARSLSWPPDRMLLLQQLQRQSQTSLGIDQIPKEVSHLIKQDNLRPTTSPISMQPVFPSAAVTQLSSLMADVATIPPPQPPLQPQISNSFPSVLSSLNRQVLPLFDHGLQSHTSGQVQGMSNIYSQLLILQNQQQQRQEEQLRRDQNLIRPNQSKSENFGPFQDLSL